MVELNKTMTNMKLVWRLSKLPTPDEIRELVKDKIIAHEEARELLFNSETKEDRDKKSLESEIEFLRELVEKLAKRDTIIENIRYIEKPYKPFPWYNQYYTWTVGDVMNCTAGSDVTISGDFSSSDNFSSIKTF